MSFVFLFRDDLQNQKFYKKDFRYINIYKNGVNYGN